MKKHVMLDLETLGNNSRSVIVSIGAVAFDEDGLGYDFYRNVDPETCVKAGLKMDASTVMWWMQQSDDARAGMRNPEPVSLSQALADFNDWFCNSNNTAEDACVWGNGATFDNVIMANAYAAAGLQRPWKYSKDRCYRTLKALYPEVTLERTGTHHNALDDARHQAQRAVTILNVIRGRKFV